MTNKAILGIAIGRIAMLELENNAEGDAKYRKGLMDSINELKKLRDEEPDRN